MAVSTSMECNWKPKPKGVLRGAEDRFRTVLQRARRRQWRRSPPAAHTAQTDPRPPREDNAAPLRAQTTLRTDEQRRRTTRWKLLNRASLGCATTPYSTSAPTMSSAKGRGIASSIAQARHCLSAWRQSDANGPSGSWLVSNRSGCVGNPLVAIARPRAPLLFDDQIQCRSQQEGDHQGQTRRSRSEVSDGVDADLRGAPA